MLQFSDIISRVSALGPHWGVRLSFLQGDHTNWSVNINNGRNWFPVTGEILEAVFEESLSRAEAFMKEGVR